MSNDFFNERRKTSQPTGQYQQLPRRGASGDRAASGGRHPRKGVKHALNLIACLLALPVVVFLLGLAVNHWLDFQEKPDWSAAPPPPYVYYPDWVDPAPFAEQDRVPLDEDRSLDELPFGDPGGKLPRELIDRVEASVVLIHAQNKSERPLGFGSGFVVNDQGWIVTNYHVLRGAAKATVKYRDGSERAVQGMVAFDEEGDLAILRIASPPSGLKPLELAAAQLPAQGESVFAVGHPHGLKFSVTTGIVSAVRKTSELPPALAEKLDFPAEAVWVQSNAALLGGSSGGPLCDQQGRVIGVNTFIAGRQSFAFASHVRQVAALLAQPRKEVEPLPALRSPNDIENPLADLDPKVRLLWEECQRGYVQFQFDQMRKFKSRDPRPAYIEQLWKVADSERKTIAALQALWLMCQLCEPGQSDAALQRALDRLLDDHLQNRGLHSVVSDIARVRHGTVNAFLEQLAMKSPHRRVQATACFYRAVHLAVLEQPEHHATILELLDRCAKEFTDVRLGADNLAESAAQFRLRFKHLGVGKPAQELVGNDVDGKPLKLSDYRGKVVLLDFFADSSPHCALMYPYKRELVQRHADKPFALLGVNCDGGDALRQLIRDGKVTWRCWADGRKGPIAKAWQIHGYPTLFLLDAQGVIRHVYHGRPDEPALDRAIEKLVQEALAPKDPAKSGSASGASGK